MTPIFFIRFELAFKIMKNGVYFIVTALVVAELFKIFDFRSLLDSVAIIKTFFILGM